jgi:hypothetical protein
LKRVALHAELKYYSEHISGGTFFNTERLNYLKQNAKCLKVAEERKSNGNSDILIGTSH